MKREQYYINKCTGEITESHKKAMKWYRSNYEVQVWYFLKVCDEWICKIEWLY